MHVRWRDGIMCATAVVVGHSSWGVDTTMWAGFSLTLRGFCSVSIAVGCLICAGSARWCVDTSLRARIAPSFSLVWCSCVHALKVPQILFIDRAVSQRWVTTVQTVQQSVEIPQGLLTRPLLFCDRCRWSRQCRFPSRVRRCSPSTRSSTSLSRVWWSTFL